MTIISKADNSNGVMVALYPNPAVADLLAQPGGEPAQDLHVTLAYLGQADALPADAAQALKQLVAERAAGTPTIVGQVSGTGLFTAGPEPVTYASVDIPGLAELRTSLVEHLSWVDDLDPSTVHGFTPHITLAYDARTLQIPNVTLIFDALSVVIGDERTDFPLYGIQKAEAEWVVPLWKAQETEERIVYGVVLQPGVTDSQGDVVSAEEIRKAAHRWLAEARLQDVQHDEQHNEAIVPVESFIAHDNLEVAGRPVLKGSWVLASLVNDDAVWDKVKKDEITGYSMSGSAIRSET